LPNCDPLEQDCSQSQLCLPNTAGDAFVCVLDASGGAHPYGSPCEFLNVCNPGLWCIDASSVPEPACENAVGCCSPVCDLDAAEPCPGAGLVCTSYYESGSAPEGYEHIGVCALP